jgi:hypothetical protein
VTRAENVAPLLGVSSTGRTHAIDGATFEVRHLRQPGDLAAAYCGRDVAAQFDGLWAVAVTSPRQVACQVCRRRVITNRKGAAS